VEQNQTRLSSKNRIRPFGKVLLLIVILILLSLYIMNASRPGRAAEGCPEGCATTVEPGAGPLRVVSLNMLHGFPSFKDLQLRLDLIATEIRRLDADVVLLQEVPWTIGTGNAAEVVAQKLGYNYLYYRANGNKNLIFFEEGEAILSRFPLKEAIFTELQPRAGLFESRVTLGAKAATPWGEVTFYVAHLTDKDPKVNAGQADDLSSFVEAHTSGLAVVAGDFNAREDTPQIKQLASVWTDTYRVAHPNDKGLTCCIDDLTANPGEPLEERIDYIFLVHESGKIISVEHVFDHPFKVGDGWQWASDHTGLMVEIQP
jgi:endonuclease/exonuclease/phosphatase family metal-dependent hydrolase